MRAAALSILFLFVAACRDPLLQGTEEGVGFSPPAVNLGQTWPGGTLSGFVRVQNRGRSPLRIEWTVPQGFTFSALPQELPAGEVTVSIRYHADQVENREGVLVANADSGQVAELHLTAVSLPIPPCPTPVACHAVHFDVEQGRCVEEALEDGTACDPHSQCVLDASCQGGRCVGTPKVCDDQNACTLNVCNAVTGCEFPPAPPCPGDGRCQVGTCDPVAGCLMTNAPDGTSCGAVGCDAAEVCIAGACVVRDPPDGYVCAEASPCQDQGICQGSACVRPPAVALAPTWSFDSNAPAAQDGGVPLRLHDFVMEPSGDLSLFGFYAAPVLRASSAQPVALEQNARRCIDWNGRAACADYGPGSTNGTVALLDFATGTPAWIFTLARERPEIARENDTVFMARLASMGSDRLLAVFESYPAGTSGTDCRAYYLLALDSAGTMQWVQKLSDPLLSACNHPHPYGVATDVDGNIYLSFSPSLGTSNGNAPLEALYPTLFMSFTRDGALRWSKVQGDMRGGELAVAGGRVFPEHSTIPFDAATGAWVAEDKRGDGRPELGRIVASGQRYVSAPPTNLSFVPERTLNAYTPDGVPDWTYTLPNEGDGFTAGELRTIDWQARPDRPSQTAVLGLARVGGQNSLVAVKERTGEELWICPLSQPLVDLSQPFEVANGSFALMTGADTCGDCDPPYAYSSASFWKFEAPGMTPANLPWPGTFGGASHDHAEKGYLLPSGASPSN